jgi:molybdopterin converting factor small subunit
MVTLVLPAYLVALLPEHECQIKGTRRLVSLQPGTWQALVGELSQRFPLLAKRVLLDGASLAHGFVLVINDQIVRGDCAAMSLGNGDELAIIAAVAGG